MPFPTTEGSDLKLVRAAEKRPLRSKVGAVEGKAIDLGCGKQGHDRKPSQAVNPSQALCSTVGLIHSPTVFH